MKHEISSMQTKKALAAALKKLAREKPFSKITVREIISVSGFNRNTFYYHFEDVYALLKWMLEQEAIEVVKQFDLIAGYEEAILFVMDLSLIHIFSFKRSREACNSCMRSKSLSLCSINRFFLASRVLSPC